MTALSRSDLLLRKIVAGRLLPPRHFCFCGVTRGNPQLQSFLHLRRCSEKERHFGMPSVTSVTICVICVSLRSIRSRAPRALPSRHRLLFPLPDLPPV